MKQKQLVRRTFSSFSVVAAFALANEQPSRAQTTWISTSSSLWSTAANWNNGLPSTGPQLAIYADSATIQHAFDVAGTARVSIGMQFNLFTGGAGFVFNSSANPGPGMVPRAGGTVNGIVNNDENTQTCNVPVKLTSNTGVAGAAAAMVFNAANGGLLFNGTNQSSAPWTINLNGASSLTFSGSGNITVGTTSGGAIVNTNLGTAGGLIKNGSGTLTLGGTLANTFAGTNFLNAGTVVAAKANALGSGNALTLGGGTFDGGGLNQTFGTLNLAASSTLNLGSGADTESFANSSAFNWGGFTLTVTNWTALDTLRFGTDNSGLTPAQLQDIVFPEFGNAHGQIDSLGDVTPAPEPSALVGILGGFALLFRFGRRRIRR